MGYRWKPSAKQKAEYIEKCNEKEKLNLITASKAIRLGCFVRFYSMSKGCVISGLVINSSYGNDKGQHTFTIEDSYGKTLVKGRNIYPNILEHIQGEQSKLDSHQPKLFVNLNTNKGKMKVFPFLFGRLKQFSYLCTVTN